MWEERTSNIWEKFVTLEVSKLSGWLNADAPCRVARRAYDAERGADWEAGEAWAGGSARAACTARGPGCEGWGGLQGMRGAHPEHVAHVRDAGGVEAERLVERRRALPSRKEGVRCRARRVGRGREGVGRRQRISGMHGERARL